MNFFIDPQYVQQQATSDKTYGAQNANAYQVTLSFKLTAATSALACVSGHIIVCPDTANNLASVVLQPQGSVQCGPYTVKYFVYRGLSLASFKDPGTGGVAQANSDFINRLSARAASRSHQLSLDDIGFVPVAFNDVAQLFAIGNQNANPALVKEGESLGQFAFTAASTNDEFGFEVILETDRAFPVSSSYLQARKTVLSPATGGVIDEIISLDAIHRSIDPLAFYSFYWKSGVKLNGQLKVGADIYSALFAKFATRNTVYLDVRNELGHSYNFFNNYSATNGENITIGAQTPVEYATDGWPILTLGNVFNGNQPLSFKLRVDDNTNPFLLLDDDRFILQKGANNALAADDLILSGQFDWTDEICLKVKDNFFSGTNACCHITLRYYKGCRNSAPATAPSPFRTQYYHSFLPLSDLFGIDLTANGGVGATEKIAPLLVEGEAFNREAPLLRTPAFSHLSKAGAYWDSQRILFYTVALPDRSKVFRATTPEVYYTNLGGTAPEPYFNGFTININSDNKRGELFRDRVGLTCRTVDVPTIGQVKVLDLFAAEDDSGECYKREALTCIGLTKAEFNALQQEATSAFVQGTDVLLYLEETPTPVNVIGGGLCRKYSVKLLGCQQLYARGTSAFEFLVQNTNIEVFTVNGVLLCSHAFTSYEMTQTSGYKLSIEEEFFSNDPVLKTSTSKKIDLTEKIGIEKIIAKESFAFASDSEVNYPGPYFSTLALGLKAVVLSFKAETNAAIATGDYLAKISALKAVIEQRGKDLFSKAVEYVQGLGTIDGSYDDRPLYWSRMDCMIHLKRLQIFNQGSNLDSKGKVIPGSDLDALVTLLEEKSRNYTGVDFSSHTGLKILITGFDPYGFTANIDDRLKARLSNPSGVAALALHGKVLSGNKLILCMVLPVRYEDFDGIPNSHKTSSGGKPGVVEKYIGPFITNRAANVVLTLSQAGPGEYHVERIATALRGGSIDNNGQLRKKLSLCINPKPRRAWLENSLPISIVPDYFSPDGSVLAFNNIVYHQYYEEKLWGSNGNPIPHNDIYRTSFNEYNYQYEFNTKKNDIEYKKIFKKDKIDMDSPGKEGEVFTASDPVVAKGSGDNFISNEIFFRVCNIRRGLYQSEANNASAVMNFYCGHFHISRVQWDAIPNKVLKESHRLLVNKIKSRVDSIDAINPGQPFATPDEDQ